MELEETWRDLRWRGLRMDISGGWCVVALEVRFESEG